MKKLLTGLFLLAFLACGTDQTELLYGKWQAYRLQEEGADLPIDTQTVYFRFFDTGVYEFHSTLNYEEAGYFRLQSDLLLTTDTLHAGSVEKAVRIEWPAPDSLLLEMRENEKERLLYLYKAN